MLIIISLDGFSWLFWKSNMKKKQEQGIKKFSGEYRRKNNIKIISQALLLQQ